MLRRTCLLAVVFLAACAGPVQPLPPAATPTPAGITPIISPRDFAAHNALTEWWYLTGHLQAEDGRRFGFEFTIFQLRRENSPTGVLAHFAVTDVDAKRFSHQARSVTGPSQEGFDFNVQGWRLSNDGSADEIDAQLTAAPGAEQPYGLKLRLVDEKPPALHHGGYITYGDEGSSYYYSRTRLAASGLLRDASGATVTVTGPAWADHQWGDFVISGVGGWDWFSIQLDNNTELMLYELRDRASVTSAVFGSLIRADGTVQDIGSGSVRVDATGQWLSPHSAATYPSGWLVELPEQHLALTVTPQLQDQELYFPGAVFAGPTYWEGAVDVHASGVGSPTGVGYVELTGLRPTRTLESVAEAAAVAAGAAGTEDEGQQG